MKLHLILATLHQTIQSPQPTQAFAIPNKHDPASIAKEIHQHFNELTPKDCHLADKTKQLGTSSIKPQI